MRTYASAAGARSRVVPASADAGRARASSPAGSRQGPGVSIDLLRSRRGPRRRAYEQRRRRRPRARHAIISRAVLGRPIKRAGPGRAARELSLSVRPPASWCPRVRAVRDQQQPVVALPMMERRSRGNQPRCVRTLDQHNAMGHAAGPHSPPGGRGARSSVGVGAGARADLSDRSAFFLSLRAAAASPRNARRHGLRSIPCRHRHRHGTTGGGCRRTRTGSESEAHGAPPARAVQSCSR